MQLSLKLKSFSDIFFVPFLETTLNFEHFGKKDDRRTYFIWETTDCQRPG